MHVIFVSGPYRGESESVVERNIQRAASVSRLLWRLGYTVICPHTNSARFGGICDEERFLAGYVELVRRSDAVYFMPGWQNSEGCRREYDACLESMTPYFYTVKELIECLNPNQVAS